MLPLIICDGVYGMPKKSLKLKDWQDQARAANPEMFDDGKPLPKLKLKDEPVTPASADAVECAKRAFGWFKLWR